MSEGGLARLRLAEMDAAAAVMRAAFDARLPGLSGLHTAEEDRRFFRTRVFATCAVWGWWDGGVLAGVIAFRPGWVEQLYVLPEWQGRGVGTALLGVAQRGGGRLSLWTFQENTGARRFYERRGFLAREWTDGARNEEGAPDVRYDWAGE